MTLGKATPVISVVLNIMHATRSARWRLPSLRLIRRDIRYFSAPHGHSDKVVLRQYQEECVEACHDALKSGTTRIGVSLPTASGKTVVFLTLLNRISAPPESPHATRALIIVNSIELVHQTAAQARKLCPHLTVEIDQGSTHKASGSADVTIGTYQTLRQRTAKFDPRRLKAIIIDEAHHAAAPSYRRILSRFNPDVKHPDGTSEAPTLPHPIPILGFSATFHREDKHTLESVFERLVYHLDLKELVKKGWLSEPQHMTVEADDIDYSDVAISKQSGDYNTNNLAEKMDTDVVNKLIVQTWLFKAVERKSTLVFCVNITHVHHLTSAFRAAGVDAQYIDASTPLGKRQTLIQSFKNGEYLVLLNCAVLIEGVDIPNIDCVVLARPSRSRNLIQQMIGRGLRLSPQTGKRDCLILDFVNAIERFADMTSEPSLFNPNADDDRDPENDTNDKRRISSPLQAPANDLEKELQKYDDLSKIPDATNIRFSEYTLSDLQEVNSEDISGVASELPSFSPGAEYNETPPPSQLHAPASDAEKDVQISNDLNNISELQPVHIIAIVHGNSGDILGITSKPTLSHSNAQDVTDNKAQPLPLVRDAASDVEKDVLKDDGLRKTPEPQSVPLVALVRDDLGNMPGVISEPTLSHSNARDATDDEGQPSLQMRDAASDVEKVVQKYNDLRNTPERQSVYLVARLQDDSGDTSGVISEPSGINRRAESATDDETQQSHQVRDVAGDAEKDLQEYEDLRKAPTPAAPTLQPMHVVALIHEGNAFGMRSESSLFNRNAQSPTDDEIPPSFQPHVPASDAEKKYDDLSNIPNSQSVDVVDHENSFAPLDQHLPSNDQENSANQSSGERFVRSHSRFAWVECDEDVYILDCYDQGYISIGKIGADTNSYTAHYHSPPSPGEDTSLQMPPTFSRLVLAEAAPLSQAVRDGDTYARTNLVMPNLWLSHAAWRSNPASEAQKIFILRLWKALKQVDEFEEDAVNQRYPELTKGMAADMITRLKHAAWNQVPVETTAEMSSSDATDARQAPSPAKGYMFRTWNLFRWLWESLRLR